MRHTILGQKKKILMLEFPFSRTSGSFEFKKVHTNNDWDTLSRQQRLYYIRETLQRRYGLIINQGIINENTIISLIVLLVSEPRMQSSQERRRDAKNRKI